jgi:hypothetical protein
MIFISFFILGIAVISYNFRYEITLLSRILRVSLFRDHHKRPEEHDVYLSFNVAGKLVESVGQRSVSDKIDMSTCLLSFKHVIIFSFLSHFCTISRSFQILFIYHSMLKIMKSEAGLSVF